MKPTAVAVTAVLCVSMGCGSTKADTAPAGTTPPTTTPPSTAPTTPSSTCDATHPNLGWTAVLDTLFHDTAGTAVMVDDCTIRVDDFTYDGTGLDVRFYGALGSDFGSGFPMTGDLRRDGGYSGETVYATLPAGTTLDDVDSMSLWCIDAAVSFGEGVFAAP